jgi:DNA-binding transcriptional LysR family regulator
MGDRDPELVRVTDEKHTETIWLVAPTELARTRAVRKVIAFVSEAFAADARALRG